MTQSYSTDELNTIPGMARALRAQGIQAVPVTEDGLKNIDHLSPTPTTDPNSPRAKWAQHRKTWIPDDVAEDIFPGRTGIGMITGVGFRDDGLKLGMIEIDDPDLVDLFLDTAEAAGVDVVLQLFREGYVVRSPGGGLHAYYLCEDVPKNTKLAQRPAPTDDDPNACTVLIETRGTGGFAVTAPSHGTVHPSGNPYELIHGGPPTIPVATIEEQEEFFAFARVFDEVPKREIKPRAKASTVDGDKPGHRYDDAATEETVRKLLEDAGWTVVYATEEYVRYRRPGKDRGVSATYFQESGQFYVFTTSTAFEAERSYSAFGIYTILHHGGDWSAAAKQLYADGWGKQPHTKMKFTAGGKSSHHDNAGDSEEEAFEGEYADDPDAIPAIKLNGSLRVAGNRFWVQDGFAPTPLTNAAIRFDQYIIEEIAPGEFQYSYRMVGTLMDGTPLPPITIPTEELGNIHYWTGRNGPLWARVTLEPGLTVRDQVRACIQLYSQHAGFEGVRKFSETGWVEIDGERVFRTHRAAIGRDGVREDVDVQLGADFARYTLTSVPAKDALADHGRHWLRLLDLGPDATIAPIALSHVRAILGECIPVDYLLYLYGLTGVFKTELSVLMMAHFGPTFTSRSIPLNFEGTQNSTQAATWRAKDVVTVVDDMAPGGTRNQIDAKYGLLDNLGRMAGNRAGRTRSNADMTAKQTFYPRGLIIASGEDLPRGHSATARMTTVEIVAGTINQDVLTECQTMAREGVFAQLTAGIIQYIAANWEEIAAGVDRLHAAALADMRSLGFKHRRTGDAIAPMIVAAQVWFEYLRYVGSISEKERDQLVDRMRKGLIATGEAQDAVQQEANPTEIFIASVRSAVLRGDAHLSDRKSNNAPMEAARFGWKVETRNAGGNIDHVETSLGSKIGWVDLEANALYLDPDSAYAVAQRLGRDTGRTIPTTVTTLGKRLQDAKRIMTTEAPGRVKAKIYVAGSPARAWHLRLSDIFPEPEPGDSDREPTPFTQKGVA